ncbi:hypothetical protein, partial [Streptomyces flavofungini]|uniref:hypothetical protein n=1 Tax=Streptomyces flavofungini TaxID=68200 RepID=UPI0034DFE274
MRTARTLRNSVIAVVATAGIGLGAASGAVAAEPTGRTASAVSGVESIAHAKAKRTYVKSVKLRDGSTARIYKLGKNRAQAEIWVKGHKAATLTARGKNVTVNHNGLHIRLTPKGTVTSWMDSVKPKPKPKPKPAPHKRVLVASPTLADGSSAKVYKLSAHHYQADLFGSGGRTGTLDANGRADYGQNNGLHGALQPDGRLSSWVDEPDPVPAPDNDGTKPAPRPTPDTDDVKP